MSATARPVLIVVGSESDRPKIEPAFRVLDDAKVGYDFVVSSAHRDPEKTAALVKGARAAGYRVLICGAGLAAALPGFAASQTDLPVVGVPFDVGPLRGQDALYAMVQLPGGVPVGTVGIDNAKNAAHLAIRILRA
ncbi:MAG TPA: AIR carboxylase family protein [Gemmatimonadales bacterium]|nr:AIR carboxylase family protein [Gemmatimonadales bacterium]